MKLQPASQKELLHISVGTLLCAAVMVGVFALLDRAGIYPFSLSVIWAALGGSAVAILNFALLCLTVQKVAEMGDNAKNARAAMQASYNTRMMLQGVWCVLALVLPCFQAVAGILPLLFPRVAIFLMQRTGRVGPEQSGTQPGDAPEQTPGQER